MTGPEDFQIIDSRLDRLREIYQNETCKSAISRTRRAETNAKALEVILQARDEDDSASPMTSSEAIQMELEDTCSRLANRIDEVETLRSQIADLKSQQAIDNDNIESLQESLERLHRVSGEYRSDRDKLSGQLIGLFSSVKRAGKDENISMDDLKKKLDDKQISLVDSAALADAEDATRVAIGDLEQLVLIRDQQIVDKQSVVEDLTESVKEMQLTIKNLNSQIALLGQANETLRNDVQAQAAQVTEYETKINEWSDWATNVTADLEARNKEIELLEEFKKHATEEIALLDERVKELSASRGGEDLESYREKISNLEAEKMELEKKIYEWSEWAETVTSEMDGLKANSDRSATLREDLEIAKAENVENLAKLESVRESMDGLRSKMVEKEAEVEELKSVQADLRRAENRIANLSDQLLISENLVSGAAEQQEKICEELRAKLLVRESTISALGKAMDAAPSRLTQIQNLEAEIVLLREAQGSVVEREAEVHKLYGQVAILNGELERLTARIDQLETERETVVNELEATRVELHNRSEVEKFAEEKSESIEREFEDLRTNIGRLETEIAEKAQIEQTLRLEIERISEVERLARDESEIVSDRLREQIRMLEESLTVPETSPSKSLEAERADMEQKLIAWNKWADEVTGQLAERDATIADLMSGRDNLDESLKQAEELRQRVADLESTAVERERNLSDDSPIGRKFEELEKAHAEISELRDLLEKAQTGATHSPGIVSSEEAEVLLDAYRAEIDRLSKENSRLRTEVKKTASAHTANKQPPAATSSWWNVLPDIEDDENEISK